MDIFVAANSYSLPVFWWTCTRIVANRFLTGRLANPYDLTNDVNYFIDGIQTSCDVTERAAFFALVEDLIRNFSACAICGPIRPMLCLPRFFWRGPTGASVRFECFSSS